MSTSTTTQLPTDWVPDGYTEKRLTVDDKEYFTVVGGSGPTVVLLHGWPQTSRVWRHVMPELARTHTVVVPDLLGAGNTEITEDGYGKVDQARDLGDLLERLGLPRKAHVVGHDIGAMVAFAWAASRPTEVESLTVIDVTLPGIDLEDIVANSDGAMWHFNFFAAPFPFPELLFDGHQDEFFTMTFNALSNPGTFSEEDLAYYVAAYEGRDRLRGGFEQYRAFKADGAEFRKLVDASSLQMPVLAIGGGDRMGESVASALAPHADNLIGRVAPTGHFVAEEDPAWLLDALRKVL